MAINYTIHPESAMGNNANQSRPAPMLQRHGGERLALGSASANINGPCELHLVADEDVWIDIGKVDAEDNVTLDAAASPMKLVAGMPYWFSVGAGKWRIEGAAA